MARRVRVVLADDHPLYRDALAATVRARPELELLAVAPDGRQALAEIRAHHPDVAILDMKMGGLDGVKVTEALTSAGLHTRVLMLSAFLESAIVFSAIAAGARGYLSKESGANTICDAIAAVARGETVLPQGLHEGLAQEIRERSVPDATTLSERETDVLRLAAEGCSVAETATRLHVSSGTVKAHLQSLYRKLGVGDRAAAVAEGMRRGVLE